MNPRHFILISPPTHILYQFWSSAASWVLDNIINNRGGLYDRTTCEIHLSPFTLQECEQYLHSKNIQLDRYSQALSYMAIGGIPYYLSMIKRGESIAANIEMKFYNTDFLVDKGYDAVLRNKLATFMEESKVRKSPIMTLITTFELKYNEYSGRFQSVITLEDLF